MRKKKQKNAYGSKIVKVEKKKTQFFTHNFIKPPTTHLPNQATFKRERDLTKVTPVQQNTARITTPDLPLCSRQRERLRRAYFGYKHRPRAKSGGGNHRKIRNLNRFDKKPCRS